MEQASCHPLSLVEHTLAQQAVCLQGNCHIAYRYGLPGPTIACAQLNWEFMAPRQPLYLDSKQQPLLQDDL